MLKDTKLKITPTCLVCVSGTTGWELVRSPS